MLVRLSDHAQTVARGSYSESDSQLLQRNQSSSHLTVTV
jgi:hypothetical protein